MLQRALSCAFAVAFAVAACGDVADGSSSPEQNVAAISASKLGPQIMGNANDPAAVAFLDACPRVAKWVLPATGATASIASFRRRCPAGTVVLRVFVPRSVRYLESEDPAAAADAFWGTILGHLADLEPSQVDWLEGPNELDNVPSWCTSPTAATWFAGFWSQLADRIDAGGYHPLVGSIAPRCARPGGPTLSASFAPTASVMKAKPYPWAWSYHAYSTSMSADPSVETYPLGYRAVRNDCGLRGTPIILSEGGGLVLGPGGAQGWRAGTRSPSEYLTWLEWFDARMAEDPAVVGLTLFQVGSHGDFASYDVSAIVPDLTTYLRAAR